MGETMTEASPSQLTRVSRGRIDWRSFSLLGPILAAFAMVTAGVFLLQGLASLSSWSVTYGPTAAFTVTDCTTERARVASRVSCEGTLVTDDAGKSRASVLVGPASAFGTAEPPAGTVIPTYYERGSTDRSFPASGRSIELARAIVGVIPLLFVVGGLLFWLIGWALTRDRPADPAERTEAAQRWRQRLVLRGRGALWAAVGLAWLVFDRFIVGDLLGSAGLG